MDLYGSGSHGSWSAGANSQSSVASTQPLPRDEHLLNSPNSGKSFGDTQMENFDLRLGLLILHLVAALMFLPSLMAWLQRIGMSQNFPGFVDSILCLGIILHGVSGWKPDISSLRLPLPEIHGRECGLSLLYLLSGYHSYFSALAFVPFQAFHSIAAIGAISFLARLIDRRVRDKNETYVGNRRKHSHKH